MTTDAATDRLRALRKLHALAHEAGMREEERRDLYERTTGLRSASGMSLRQIEAVCSEIRVRPRGRMRLDGPPAGPQGSKLRALWISGFELGVVRDRDDSALAAWMRRQIGVAAARWTPPDEAAACIDALRDWLAREAGVDWSHYRARGKTLHDPRGRVLEAQWRRLQEAGAMEAAVDLEFACAAILGTVDRRPVETLRPRDADRCIRVLGARLRSALSEAAR